MVQGKLKKKKLEEQKKEKLENGKTVVFLLFQGKYLINVKMVVTVATTCKTAVEASGLLLVLWPVI